MLRAKPFTLLGALVLASALLESTVAAETGSPCVCGSSARLHVSGTAIRPATRAKPEAAGCASAGVALLRAAYDLKRKIPPGFRGDKSTDYAQIISVYWVDHPSAPIVVGPYQVDSTLSAAASLDDARVAVRSFLQDGASRHVDYPHLAGSSVVQELEQPLFFEFRLPSDDPPMTVAFRIWKASFLSPATFAIVPSGYDTGLMELGHVAKDVAVDEVRLFLEQIWWENNGNSTGTKVLALPKATDSPGRLRVTLPVASVHGGDMPDEVYRKIWKVEVNRRTGAIIRDIEPDIVCRGHASGGPVIMN